MIAEETPVESTDVAADAVMDPVEQAMADAEMAASEIPAAAEMATPAWVPSDDYRLPDLAPQVDPDKIIEEAAAAAQAMLDSSSEAPEIVVDDGTAAAGAPDETIVIEEAAAGAEIVAEAAAPLEAPQPAATLVAVKPSGPAPQQKLNDITRAHLFGKETSGEVKPVQADTPCSAPSLPPKYRMGSRSRSPTGRSSPSSRATASAPR